MRKKRLIWHIYPYYILIIITCILVFGIYFVQALEHFNYQKTKQELRIAATLMATELSGNNNITPENVTTVCKKFSNASSYRFTIILPTGKVIADTRKDIRLMDNHSDRPEIMQAQKTGFGSNIRYSHTLKMNMLYVAVPITINGKDAGTVRVAISLDRINTTIQAIWYKLIGVALLISILAIVATVITTGRINRQLSLLGQQVKAFGEGKFNNRLPSSDITEIDLLSKNFNDMAEQLQKRIDTIIKQRDEQNVLWACMTESVIAVDNDKNILRINHSAENLFSINSENVRGKNIIEFIRYPDLLDIIDKTLNSKELIEENFFLADKNKYLQAHGSIIHDNKNSRIGALIVLTDITKLRKLEAMRKDFVANVSHELKTPITSIKGFIETLLDAEVPEEEQIRFMKIIKEQANNLHAIVDDLLTLSSIEYDMEDNEILLENVNIARLLKSSIQTCSRLAEQKKIKIKVNVSEEITATINPQLMEQAVTNLIDNAIKYSPAETEINVNARSENNNIIIEVIDQGEGIAPKYQSRIFQRFYRVDKSRSRKSGGTGLGLAIVKHIILAHNGTVTVKSKPGEGSTFIITIPKA